MANEAWKATRAIGGEALKQAPAVLPVAGALSGGDSEKDAWSKYIEATTSHGKIIQMSKDKTMQVQQVFNDASYFFKKFSVILLSLTFVERSGLRNAIG